MYVRWLFNIPNRVYVGQNKSSEKGFSFILFIYKAKIITNILKTLLRNDI